MPKQLAIYDTITNRLEGLDPARATAIAVPTFRMGAARPAVGSATGEAFINTTTGIASVWDGNGWDDIAKPIIAVYPDDPTLIADNPGDDTVALSTASGNLFVRTGGAWKPLTIRTYATQAALTADSPPNGVLGFATDTGQFAVRVGGVWATLSNQGVTIGTTAPPTPVAGNLWLDTSGTGRATLKVYSNGNWVTPNSLPDGGTAGQLLSKIDAVNGNARWVNPPSTLPAFTGHSNQYLRVNSSGNAAEWGQPVLFGTGNPTMNAPDGTIYVKY